MGDLCPFAASQGFDDPENADEVLPWHGEALRQNVPPWRHKSPLEAVQQKKLFAGGNANEKQDGHKICLSVLGKFISCERRRGRRRGFSNL